MILCSHLEWCLHTVEGSGIDVCAQVQKGPYSSLTPHRYSSMKCRTLKLLTIKDINNAVRLTHGSIDIGPGFGNKLHCNIFNVTAFEHPKVMKSVLARGSRYTSARAPVDEETRNFLLP